MSLQNLTNPTPKSQVLPRAFDRGIEPVRKEGNGP